MSKEDTPVPLPSALYRHAREGRPRNLTPKPTCFSAPRKPDRLRRMDRVRLLRRRTGVAGTVVWSVLVAALLYWSKTSLSDLKLNEAGDLLAGIFAPVAFLWVIIGYFQQGDELFEHTQMLAGTHRTNKIDVFLTAYDAYRRSLCLMAASLCRAHFSRDKWASNMEQFGKGHIEVFCNALRNRYRKLGRDGFLAAHHEFFHDTSTIQWYVAGFEAIREKARDEDDSGVTLELVERSALGNLYIPMCECIKKRPILTTRDHCDPESWERLDEDGWQ